MALKYFTHTCGREAVLYAQARRAVCQHCGDLPYTDIPEELRDLRESTWKKISKVIKFEVETAPGTKIDLSKYFRGGTLTHVDGSKEKLQPEQYLKELDEKYENILTDIVTKRKG
jgi:hypothetical protein